MKRFYKLVLSAICFHVYFMSGIFAQPIITTAGSYNGPEGAVSIPVTVDNLSGVAGISLSLNIPASFMTYQSYTMNAALAGGFCVVNFASNKVLAAWFGLAPIALPAGSVLFTFNFTGTEGSGILDWDTLTVGYCQYSDIVGNPFPATWVDGSIQVSNVVFPPLCAINPLPANGSLAYPAALGWTGGGGEVSGYRVYFGTDNPPQTMVQDNNMTSYATSGLLPGTQYYWKVVPYNEGGEAGSCSLWHFTTPTVQSIAGLLTYQNPASTPLTFTWVKLVGSNGLPVDSSLTDSNGHFSLQAPPGEYTLMFLHGKSWGGVNSVDAYGVLRHTVELQLIEGLAFTAGDVNASASLNAVDALLIARRYVELIASFVIDDWVYAPTALTLGLAQPMNLEIKVLCAGDVNGSFIPSVACTPMPTPSNAGPDQNVTGTTTTLAANTPVNGTGAWSIVAGAGGNLVDPADPASGFSGFGGNTYTLVWTITTVCAASTDTVQISFTNPSFTCGSPFTDTRDGQVYTTVQIGTQCWMQQNLNIGAIVLSTNTGSSHSECSNNGIIEKYCYNNDPANCAVYGGLYDWNEMMCYTTTPGVQGICPAGWHIPTDAEWCALSSFLDQNANCNVWGEESYFAGGKLKETGFTHWYSPNTGATNESGFTALPGGYRHGHGYFESVGFGGYWWSSSEYSPSYAIARPLNYLYANVDRGNYGKTAGFTVRCLRDE